MSQFPVLIATWRVRNFERFGTTGTLCPPTLIPASNAIPAAFCSCCGWLDESFFDHFRQHSELSPRKFSLKRAFVLCDTGSGKRQNRKYYITCRFRPFFAIVMPPKTKQTTHVCRFLSGKLLSVTVTDRRGHLAANTYHGRLFRKIIITQ